MSMTVNQLIQQLTEIRDAKPEHGDLPVQLSAQGVEALELIIPFGAEGGPVTQDEIPLTGVQLTTVF